MDKSSAIAAHVRTLETQARDPKPQEGPTEAGSSWNFVYLLAIILWHVKYYGFKTEESFTAGAARQPGPTESDLRRYKVEQAGYVITDTWDEIVDTLMEMDPTTLEGDSLSYKRSPLVLVDGIQKSKYREIQPSRNILSMPSPTVESTSEDGQNRISSVFENGEPTDSILSKPAVKFVKAVDRPAERPTTNKAETVKKPTVKYAEMYRRPSKKPTVRGNQQNWNNLKSQQLGPDISMKKQACYNCGEFSHLANDCRKMVQRETTRSQNHAYKSPSHRSYGAPIRPSHRPAGHRPHGPLMRPMRSNMNGARPKRTSAVRPQYRALWVPTVNRNFPPVNRKLPAGNSNVSTICCCCSRHVNTARPKAVINRRNRVKDV
nr:hypothetical protein [Tanacetum cinerariifolium]